METIVLFQFRESFLEIEERQNFTARIGLPRRSIVAVNLMHADYTMPDITAVRHIIICGSSSSLTLVYPWHNDLVLYIKEAIAREIPVLGICFGHHFLAKLAGSEIITDPASKELGAVTVDLTPEGACDPLFKNVPQRFTTITGHNDSVQKLTPPLQLLATNAACAIQAFKMRDAVVYGVQFHPEMDEEDYRKRIFYYRDYYVARDADYNAVLAAGAGSITDKAILSNFLNL